MLLRIEIWTRQMKANHGLLCLRMQLFTHPQLCQGSAKWSELLQIVPNGLSLLNIWRRQIKSQGVQCTSHVVLWLIHVLVSWIRSESFFLRTFWIVLGTMLFFLGRRESNAKYFNLYIYFHRLLSNCSHLLYSCLPPYSRAIAQSNPDSGAFAVRVGTGSTASGSWPTVALGRCSLQRFGQSQQHLAAGACDPDMCVAMKGSPATQLGWQRYWSWYYEVAT